MIAHLHTHAGIAYQPVLPKRTMTPTYALAVGLAALWSAACEAREPDFTLVPPDSRIELALGQLTGIEVEVVRSGDFADTIVVSATGLRAGITAGAVRFPLGTDSGELLFLVETSVVTGPLGDAELIGVASDLERRAPIDLIVIDSSGAP